MPLTNPEKHEVARAFLRCWGEDFNNIGKALAYINKFTTGQGDLLSITQQEARTWQPFIDAGLSIDPGFVQELERVFNQQTAGA